MIPSEVRVAAIVGPTAVGKTSAAVRVAEVLGAEVVSVDSMQIYRGMDIGTDKADLEARRRVPHHLLDLKDPSEEISVLEFRDLARAAISDIAARGKLPLLVGGSGLYFRAVVDDLRFPPTSVAVRTRVSEQLSSEGTAAMYERLKELDPKAVAKIEPNNARRIIRALEVIEITGLPFSANTSWGDYRSRYLLSVAGLERERHDLFQAIESRVESMLRRGLVAEFAGLSALGATAGQALGYKQIAEGSFSDEDELKAEIVRATKRFARRQESWFRSDPRVEWFAAEDPLLPDTLVDHFRSCLAL